MGMGCPTWESSPSSPEEEDGGEQAFRVARAKRGAMMPPAAPPSPWLTLGTARPAPRSRDNKVRDMLAKASKRASHSTRVVTRVTRVSLSHHQLFPLGAPSREAICAWTDLERIRGEEEGEGERQRKTEDRDKVCDKRITPSMRIRRLCSRRPGDDFSSPLPGSTLA